MTESLKPKTQKCHSAFETLKIAYNDIIAKYSKLPSTLKAKGVKRVKFTSEDTDMGKVDMKNSKSVCKFANAYVSKLKKADTYHRTRLAAARKVLCTKGGEVLKKKMFSKLSNCLRKTTRYATGDAKRHALTDAHNFDEITRMYVQGLLSKMKEKCQMKKKSPGSKLESISNIFRETLTTQIKKVKGLFTANDRNKITEAVKEAIQKQNPLAAGITTIIEDSSRRQLRARRALASSVDVLTTWYEPDAPTVSDSVELTEVLGADYESSPAEITLESTDTSFESPEPVDSIDDQLPVIPEIDANNQGSANGENIKKSMPEDTQGASEQGSKVTNAVKEEQTMHGMMEEFQETDEEVRAVASDARGQTMFGTVTVMCMTLLMALI